MRFREKKIACYLILHFIYVAYNYMSMLWGFIYIKLEFLKSKLQVSPNYISLLAINKICKKILMINDERKKNDKEKITINFYSLIRIIIIWLMIKERKKR